jgi:hypothetical protein
MARYKEYDYSQVKFIPIHFGRQILPGSFEYSLNYLIDNEIDLSTFDARYRNDQTGAPAYDPAILLKIITMIGKRIVILHQFIKKSDKTPPRELALARRRMKEVKNASPQRT